MFPSTGDASVDGLQDFADILARWIDAEGRDDPRALDDLLDPAFQGDGPDGYVLSKQQWLERYVHGHLANTRLAWRGTGVRVLGDTAIATGVMSQIARYRGRDHSGDFQVTLVGIRTGGRWSIVNVQLTGLDRPGAPSAGAEAPGAASPDGGSGRAAGDPLEDAP